MKSVEIVVECGLTVESKHYPKGDRVQVSDQRAAELDRLGHAKIVEGIAPLPPDGNPLLDSIHPQPPAALLVVPADLSKSAPVDALAPTVEHNPGLIDLTNAVAAGAPGSPKRAGRIVPEPDAVTTTADPAIKQAPKPKV